MHMRTKSMVRTALFILVLMLTTSAWATSQLINYQGELTDSVGLPINGDVTITFSLWNDPAETDPATYRVWEEQQLVTVSNGIFNALLGNGTPLPTAYEFNSPNLYLEVAIDGVILGPRTQLSSTPAAFWSEESGNAATLAGQQVSAFASSGHTHTYTQITGNTEYVDSRVAVLETLIASQQEQIDLLLQALTPADLAQLSTEFSQLSTRVDQLETTSSGRDVLDDVVPFVSVTGNDIVLAGANLNIQNGGGTTDTTTGTGNLIIGYNVLGTAGDPRTGSHNLIIGDSHSYSSYAGIVAGEENSILAPYASIVGGGSGIVQADHGSILGGFGNSVDAAYGSIVGGVYNIVNTGADGASILGGFENETAGLYASVVGGFQNQAVGESSSVLGGEANVANGLSSAVLGGLRNVVEADEGVVLGGKDQTIVVGQEIGPLVTSFDEVMTLTNDTLRISGVNVQIVNGTSSTRTANGKGNLIIGYNEAPLPATIPGGRTGSHNIIVGESNNYDATSGIAVGYYNYLGSSGVAFGLANSITAPPDQGFPGISTAVGGSENHATGPYSAILGGNENTASGIHGAVVGGRDNIASGERSTVAGGDKNEAGGIDATVGGGLQNRAFLDKSAIPTGRYKREEIQ